MMRILFITFVALTSGLWAENYSLPYQPIPAPAAPVAYPQLSYPSPLPSPLSLPAEAPAPDASRQLKFDSENSIGTMIPLALPGYELRVMDVTKKITFDVNGSPVTAEVPLFIYMPKSSAAVQDSAKELRKVYNDLIMIYDQERVDKERVRSMLKRMDNIIDAFDSLTPSVGRHTSAAY